MFYLHLFQDDVAHAHHAHAAAIRQPVDDHVGGFVQLPLHVLRLQVRDHHLHPQQVALREIAGGDGFLAVHHGVAALRALHRAVVFLRPLDTHALQDGGELALARHRGGVFAAPHPAQRDVGQRVDAPVPRRAGRRAVVDEEIGAQVSWLALLRADDGDRPTLRVVVLHPLADEFRLRPPRTHGEQDHVMLRRVAPPAADGVDVRQPAGAVHQFLVEAHLLVVRHVQLRLRMGEHRLRRALRRQRHRRNLRAKGLHARVVVVQGRLHRRQHRHVQGGYRQQQGQAQGDADCAHDGVPFEKCRYS